MHQSVHLAIVQFKPRKGDYAGNLARLGEIWVDGQIAQLSRRPGVATQFQVAPGSSTIAKSPLADPSQPITLPPYSVTLIQVVQG